MLGTMLIIRGDRRGRRRTLAHELIAADAGGTFACRRFTVSHWQLNWHRHPELELTLIVRGAGLRYVADSVEEFAAGDLVLLGPGVPHSWSSAARHGRTCESLVAQFPADVLGPGWAGSTEARPLTALFRDAAHGLRISGATAAAIRADLQAMVGIAPGPLRLGLLLTALGRLAAAPAGERHAIARMAAEPGPGVPTSGAPAGRADPWADLVRHLDAHADGPLAAGALAARLGLSPASFARAFRRRFGTTCTTYLTRIRLARVCRALVESGASVATIAFDAGFANLANFNRRFKAAYGLTPRDYRRRHSPG